MKDQKPPPAAGAPDTPRNATPEGRRVDAGNGVSIHVRTIGAGRPVLMIPSLGRGVEEFDLVA